MGIRGILENPRRPRAGSESNSRARSGSVVFRFTSDPKNQVVEEGASATYDVAVSGTGPFQYQWQFEGTPIAGATNATLVIPRVVREHQGRTGSW